jgi:hypothetical protein
MTRIIDVYISEDNANVIAKAVYTYESKITVPAKYDEDDNLIEPSYITVLTYSPSAYYFYAGTTDDFASVHFFYYPNYNSFAGTITRDDGNYDVVTLHNDAGLTFAFFLVKQYTPGYDTGQLTALENNYHGQLELREPYDRRAWGHPSRPLPPSTRI